MFSLWPYNTILWLSFEQPKNFIQHIAVAAYNQIFKAKFHNNRARLQIHFFQVFLTYSVLKNSYKFLPNTQVLTSPRIISNCRFLTQKNKKLILVVQVSKWMKPICIQRSILHCSTCSFLFFFLKSKLLQNFTTAQLALCCIGCIILQCYTYRNLVFISRRVSACTNRWRFLCGIKQS